LMPLHNARRYHLTATLQIISRESRPRRERYTVGPCIASIVVEKAIILELLVRIWGAGDRELHLLLPLPLRRELLVE
jgi:hypothetical protein